MATLQAPAAIRRRCNPRMIQNKARGVGVRVGMLSLERARGCRITRGNVLVKAVLPPSQPNPPQRVRNLAFLALSLASISAGRPRAIVCARHNSGA